MQSTINVGLIEGGSNANVVPSAAAMTIDRRLLPAEKVDAAFAELHAILSAAGEPDGSWTLEKLTGTNGFRAAADGPGVTALGAAIAGRTGAPARLLNATGVSDGRYFADDGIEIVNFGPGSGAEGHAANESVPLADGGLGRHPPGCRAATDRVAGLMRGTLVFADLFHHVIR